MKIITMSRVSYKTLLAEYVEELHSQFIKGEIEEQEYISKIHNKMEQLKKGEQS